MKYLVWIALVIVPTSAIFFGGGGGGCGGCSSCCAPPPPPCAPAPVCAPPPPCPAPQPCGCGGGFGGGYPQVPTCRPRYIIVRPVESYSGGGYQTGGYSGGGGGGYVSSPQSYSAPVPQPSYSAGPGPSYSAPQPSYSAGPGPSYSAPQPSYSAGPVSVPQASYSAPQQSYSAPQQSYSAGPAPAVPQQSYNAGPAPAVPQSGSYTSGSGSSYKSIARASKTLVADGNCNSKELKVILESAMIAGDANESKRRIHTMANEQIHTENSQKGIDVICAPSKISYRIATDLFCEHTKEDITCFVYQQI